jgi:hypothetical protein
MLEPLKEEIFSFHPSQQEVTFHVFHDPLDNLLKVLGKEEFLLFTRTSFGSKFHFGLPTFIRFCLLKEDLRRILVSGHLLAWIYWKYCII